MGPAWSGLSQNCRDSHEVMEIAGNGFTFASQGAKFMKHLILLGHRIIDMQKTYGC